MDNTLGYELSNGGSIPSGRTKNNIKYNMFAKLNKSFNVDNFTIDKEVISYDRIKYNRVQDINHNNFYAVIPEIHRRFFRHTLMTITDDIVPHKDNGVLTSINFYIKTNGGLTNFYEFFPHNHPIVKYKTQGNGVNYHPLQLKLCGSFVANDHDAYLLDVSKPHAVLFNVPKPIFRTAVVLQTPVFNFQQVFEMLKETGNI